MNGVFTQNLLSYNFHSSHTAKHTCILTRTPTRSNLLLGFDHTPHIQVLVEDPSYFIFCVGYALARFVLSKIAWASSGGNATLLHCILFCSSRSCRYDSKHFTLRMHAYWERTTPLPVCAAVMLEQHSFGLLTAPACCFCWSTGSRHWIIPGTGITTTMFRIRRRNKHNSFAHTPSYVRTYYKRIFRQRINVCRCDRLQPPFVQLATGWLCNTLYRNGLISNQNYTLALNINQLY